MPRHSLPSGLEGARILVTNDDGIGAPGLAVLAEVAAGFTDDVWVVAPEHEQSAASHALTLTRPLRMKKYAERRWSVDGTPTDCVLLAINDLLASHKPDLVLSGVNYGSNIGDDIVYSGTVAAAMEAALLGVPAIALSQHVDWDDPEAMPQWQTARHYAPEVIARVTEVGWPRNALVNVNFPNRTPEMVTGIHVVPHGKRIVGDKVEKRIDPRGRPYWWIGVLREEVAPGADTDIDQVFAGGVSVTALTLDMNHSAMLHDLKAAFA